MSSSEGFAGLAATFLPPAPIGSPFSISGEVNAPSGAALRETPLRCLFSTASTVGSALFAWTALNLGAGDAVSADGAGLLADLAGDFRAGLVSGASVFGFAAFDGGTWASALAVALPSLSRVAFRIGFSLLSDVRPASGAE